MLRQVMHRIGVVPEQAKVGRTGPHRRKPADRLVGIGLARRVRIAWNAPHSPDGRILHQGLDRIHVGPLPGHGDGQHAEPELFAQAEMPVVARHRADEGRRRLCAPRPHRARHALQQGPNDAVMHEGKARIVAEHDRLRREAEDLGEEAAAPPAVPEAHRNCGRLRPRPWSCRGCPTGPACRSTAIIARVTAYPASYRVSIRAP